MEASHRDTGLRDWGVRYKNKKRCTKESRKERDVLVHTPPILGTVMRDSSFLGEEKGMKSRLLLETQWHNLPTEPCANPVQSYSSYTWASTCRL